MKKNSKQAGFLALTSLLSPLSLGTGKGNTTTGFTPDPSPRILGMQVDPETQQVTLRWTSKLEASYAIEESTNLRNGWTRNFLDIEGDGNETSFTFIPDQGSGLLSTRFFRILEIPPLVVEAQEGMDETGLKPEGKSKEPIEETPSQQQLLLTSYSTYKNLKAAVSTTPDGSPIEKLQFHIDPKFLVG